MSVDKSDNISGDKTSASVAKTLVTNNAASSVTCNKGFNAFLGTNAAAVAFNLPAKAVTQDQTIVAIFSQAAVATPTFVSTGATFVGAPASIAASVPFSFIYHSTTSQWLRYT